jgi:hypothetical protein
LVLNPSVISPYGVWALCGHSSSYGHQEWYMARFVVENEHQKSTCYNNIGLCAQNTYIDLGSIMNTIGRTYSWGEGVFTLTSYSVESPTMFLQLELTSICNWQPYETIPNLIQPSKLYVKLEVPIIGPRALFPCQTTLARVKKPRGWTLYTTYKLKCV